MTDKESKVLQASIDDLHAKLTTIYAAIMTINIPAGFQSAEAKAEISKTWVESYHKAKTDAAS